MQDTRIAAIYEAATRLFIQQGYSKTQISHIAKAIGVSVGTIYHDFTGKEEIMHFILKCTIDPDFINRDFQKPITDELFDDLENEIVETFKRSADSFSKNLDNVGLTYKFENLISDAFDILSEFAAGCLLIEKNQLDCQGLARYYKEYRKCFFDTMKKYINIFINKGIVRPLKNTDLTVTLIIEILTWWAMDRKYASFETLDIPIEQAKDICLDNIVSAYQLKG